MTRNWAEIDRFLPSHGVRIGQPTLGQTTGGAHASGSHHFSNHYLGTARDYGARDSNAAAVARKLEVIALQPDGPIAELFCSVGTADVFIKRRSQIITRSIFPVG
jgi:hypothetical protein